MQRYYQFLRYRNATGRQDYCDAEILLHLCGFFSFKNVDFGALLWFSKLQKCVKTRCHACKTHLVVATFATSVMSLVNGEEFLH